MYTVRYESVPEVAVDTDEDPPEVPLHEDPALLTPRPHAGP